MFLTHQLKFVLACLSEITSTVLPEEGSSRQCSKKEATEIEEEKSKSPKRVVIVNAWSWNNTLLLWFFFFWSQVSVWNPLLLWVIIILANYHLLCCQGQMKITVQLFQQYLWSLSCWWMDGVGGTSIGDQLSVESAMDWKSLVLCLKEHM